MYVYYCRTWYKAVCHANAVCTVAAFDMIEVVGGSRAGWGTVTYFLKDKHWTHTVTCRDEQRRR